MLFYPWVDTSSFQIPRINIDELEETRGYKQIVKQVREIAQREKNELDKRFPKLKRRVGGYNLDTVDPLGHNMAKDVGWIRRNTCYV